MTKRGEIVKEPLAGPGLLLVDGKQYAFTLEGDWRSQATPRVGMVVDVFLHPQAGVVAVQPTVHPAPAKPVPALAPRPSPPAFPSTPPSFAPRQAPASRAVPPPAPGFPLKTVIPDLVALVALIFGWFVLPSINFGGFGGVGFTFWRILSHIADIQSLSNSEAANSFNGGLLSLLAPVAMVGPFVFFLWKNRAAALGGILPFGLMLFVGLWVWNSVHRAATTTTSIFGSVIGGALSDSALSMFRIEVGVYLSVIACVYFAISAFQKMSKVS